MLRCTTGSIFEQAQHSLDTLNVDIISKRQFVSRYLNQMLNPQNQQLVLAHHLPLAPEYLLQECSDGVLLCCLINQIFPGTIDLRLINFVPKTIQEVLENLRLCRNSIRALSGSNFPEIAVSDLQHRSF